MKPSTDRRLRLLVSVVSGLVLLALAGGGWFYHRLRSSLPTLEGRLPVAGLSAAVTVERDELGVPTIRAGSRRDAARALGFLHAQDRFFQMDLSRRRAAGELSALIGQATVEADKRARLHGFRTLAKTVLAGLPAPQQELLAAYAAGVNDGLGQLTSKPFEYVVLRTEPEPWRPEDCVLLIYAMTLDLQDDDGRYEQSLAAVRDVLGAPVLAYFAPLVGPDDAALDGSRAPLAPMPDERYIDVRQESTGVAMLAPAEEAAIPGSNSFALAGNRTKSGSGMVANDMHLGLRVPNTWYRACIIYPHPTTGEPLRVVGVTLPGAPAIIAGSNGQIAWGFTNSYADTSDLIPLDGNSLSPDAYSRGNEILLLEHRPERIVVKGGETVEHEALWSVFGPIVGQNARGRRLAMRWTAHDPEATNFELLALETASNAEEAIAVAHRSGIPVQNMLVADRTGRIAWTLCGRLPRRVGFDGRLPVSWTFGDRRWDGLLPASEVPVVLGPDGGELWTANQRLLNGGALQLLGDGGYDRPHRAARIQSLLADLRTAGEQDLLSIQLDTGAPHLDRWHRLLAAALTDDAVRGRRDREQLRTAIGSWDGRAEADSVSYRLVRNFRREVVARVLDPVFERCLGLYPRFTYRRFHYEQALWDILERKPAHLLSPRFATWDELVLDAADGVLRRLDDDSLSVERATWGAQNRAEIKHPFAQLIPAVRPWLSMPEDPLPGDNDLPRVQTPDHGASERFVVSPGREEAGIFHMPGGQSGHPLSPFFRAGHDAWVAGRPTPFLPGPTRHTLTLEPGP